MTLSQIWSDQAGQDSVEYALLIGFVVVVSAAGIATVADALSNLWTNLNTALSNPG